MRDEGVENATEISGDDDGDHDGFFFLDGMSETELLDVRETARENSDRARKLISACDRRLGACRR
jgi:hypothetical protein